MQVAVGGVVMLTCQDGLAVCDETLVRQIPLWRVNDRFDGNLRADMKELTMS